MIPGDTGSTVAGIPPGSANIRLLKDPVRLVAWGRLLAILLPLLVYAGSLANDFLIDDEIIVSSNIRLAPGQSPLEVFRRPEQFADFTLPYYRPVTNLSYWADARLWDRQPIGFHLTNWVFHAVTTLLIFELARSLTADAVLGLIAAILFAAHPMHTESVDMVQGRTDLLATLFMLLSLLAMRRCLSAIGSGRALAAGAISLAALGVALLAKEIAVTWPALAAAVWWVKPGPRGPAARLVMFLVAAAAILAGYFAVRGAVLGGIVGADYRGLTVPHAGLVLITLADYARLLLWPFSFSFVRPMAAPDTWHDPRILQSAILLLGILVGLAVLARRNRLVAFSAGWTLVTLTPVLNLFPIPGFAMAERYLYLPSVGFCLLVAALFRPALLPGSGPAVQTPAVTLLAIIVMAYTATIQVRTAQWTDPVDVFEAMAARTPNSFFVQSKLGLEYLRSGRAPDAVGAMLRARDLEPANPVAWNNLGAALAQSGRLAEARHAYERAIALNPRYARAYENLAQVLFAMGDPVGARAAFGTARTLNAAWQNPQGRPDTQPIPMPAGR